MAVAGGTGSHPDKNDDGERDGDADGGENGAGGEGGRRDADAPSAPAAGTPSVNGAKAAASAGAGTAADAASEDGAKTDADAKPAAAGAGRVPPGDARLKAAVAAWVASTDDDGVEGPGDGREERKASSDSDAAPVDEPTQLIKAPTPAPAPAGEPTQVIKAPAPAGEPVRDTAAKPKSGAGRDDADARPADRPTAAFGVVRPDRAPSAAKGRAKQEEKAAGRDGGEPSGSSSADQPTALIKAPAVPPAAPAGTPAAAPRPAGDQGKASRFVPLKSDDDAPALGKKAAPGAPAAPGAAAAPASARPATPDRPAVPVKVTAPAPAARPAPAPAGPGGSERTTQTPMPVGPDGEKQAPLDLLAQLTNTPPPPETPARTAMRRVKIWTPIVVLLLIVFCVVQAFRPLPDASLVRGKQAAYTFGGEKFDMKWPTEGQSAAKVLGVGDLGTYGPQKPVPTASMAKVMTAYIVLRDHPLKMRKSGGQDVPEQGPSVTIDARAEKEGEAKDESAIRGLKAGQTFSEYDMLQMLLIPSGNNVARLLARWDAGSEEAFLKKMNDTAKQLGMKNTTYTDPSGLNKTTVSTAVDQVLLAEQVIRNPIVRSITTKPNTPIKGLDKGINSNIDDLLIKHTGVLGIKTGSSSPAGGTLMWAARKRLNGEEVLIVGATMDQHFKGGPDVNAEMSLKMVKRVSYEQLTAVQNALQQAVVVKKGQVVGYVDDQLGGKTPVVATKDVKGYGWGGLRAKMSLDKKKGAVLPHSAKAGTVVGELVVGSGADAVRVPVALQKALSEPSFGSKLLRLG
ncbi:D-alanyl-D-alanine carboxypeptidase family protein [Streptomyces huiliensis]|uniref:D-alanyl-D-alanine carboxypeptidase family protein n=1 Tax=Streptomyces huiliensis TaxID=2876027 RepID=UPI001CBF7B07|nr:D-alanyl-D-alanine carboxypeptidase [Streptomyces huiliensis]